MSEFPEHLKDPQVVLKKGREVLSRIRKQKIIYAIAEIKYPDVKLDCVTSEGKAIYYLQGNEHIFDFYCDSALKWDIFEEFCVNNITIMLRGNREEIATDLFLAWLKFKGVEIEE